LRIIGKATQQWVAFLLEGGMFATTPCLTQFNNINNKQRFGDFQIFKNCFVFLLCRNAIVRENLSGASKH